MSAIFLTNAMFFANRTKKKRHHLLSIIWDWLKSGTHFFSIFLLVMLTSDCTRSLNQVRQCPRWICNPPKLSISSFLWGVLVCQMLTYNLSIMSILSWFCGWSMKPIMLLKDSESRAQNSSNFEPQKLCMNTYISTKKALMYPNTCWKFVSLQLGLKTLTIPGFLALKSQFLPVSIPLLGGEKNNDQGMYAPLPTKLLTHTCTRTHTHHSTPLSPSVSKQFSLAWTLSKQSRLGVEEHR